MPQQIGGNVDAENVYEGGDKVDEEFVEEEMMSHNTMPSPANASPIEHAVKMLSVFWDTFVYHYTKIIPNFNDVYLDNYQVLDYGQIYKNNPK
jgi:hypothetical protein